MNLSNQPWRSHIPTREHSIRTLLAAEELRLLNWLTAVYYRGAGAIIDAGCFLGGSTAALASGLKHGCIHTYDMFQTGDSWPDVTFSYWGLEPNQCFENKFRENVAEYLPRIHVHSGDLLKQMWQREPVEILFLDICKTPELHDHAARLWFPRLIPGRSILIQQDYGWRRWYWGNVMMEYYKDHFTILDDVDVSRVYLCTKPIKSLKPFRRLSAATKLKYMAAALETMTTDKGRGHLLFSYAELAESLGRFDLIPGALEQIQALDALEIKETALAEFGQYLRLHLPPRKPDLVGIVKREARRLVRQASGLIS